MGKNNVLRGSVFCILSACLWGVSGAAGQYMFQNAHVTAEWLVCVRMLIAGILLLSMFHFGGGAIAEPWRKKSERKELLLFSLFGMLFAQYGYFASISHSNAATATVLQYLAPVMIVVYLAFRLKKMPAPMEVLAVIFALAGTFLLATHGNIHTLNISSQALFWGLLSAVALAFYTVYPKNLLANYPSMLLIGWAMLLGGIAMNFVHPFWQANAVWNPAAIACLVFIAIFGTMLPYMLFLDGVKRIGATRSSLYASVEPLSSTLVSVVWLHTQLEIIDYIGFAFIIATVFLLALKKEA